MMTGWMDGWTERERVNTVRDKNIFTEQTAENLANKRGLFRVS